MTNQFQCPNCGGFKVQTEIKKVDKFGKEYSKTGTSSAIFWLTGTIVILGGIQENSLQILLLIAGILFFLLGTLMYFLRVPEGTINKYYHVCSLCGYEWNRSEKRI